MVRMVLDAGCSFDEAGDAPGRPKERAKSVGFRAFLKIAFQLPEVFGSQTRLAADSSSLFESAGADGAPSFVPATGRLSVDADFASDLSLAQAALEEFACFDSPPFQ